MPADECGPWLGARDRERRRHYLTGHLTRFLADPPWWFRWVVANAWLLLMPSVVLPFARDEADAGVLAPRAALVVLLGAYLIYLARRPGWLPRA